MQLNILVIALLLTSRLTAQFPEPIDIRMVPALLNRPRTLFRTLRQVLIRKIVRQQRLPLCNERSGRAAALVCESMKPVTPLLEL